jgi:hypothetical protein
VRLPGQFLAIDGHAVIGLRLDGRLPFELINVDFGSPGVLLDSDRGENQPVANESVGVGAGRLLSGKKDCGE